MQQILRGLKSHGKIEDLDLSKTGIGSDIVCMQLLGELIISNSNMKSIGLQGLALSEKVAAYHLIDPLSKSLHIESLNFDNNNLGNVFIQNLVDKLISNKKMDNIKEQSKNQNSDGGSRDSSIMTDSESGTNIDQTFNLGQKERRTQGLVNLSFECNTGIGDKGAKAIATLIKTRNAFSNNLKMVNLNECGINNQGFEELK
mgnify:CR=1 FL=1|jgi:hypothetical protein